MPIIRHGDRARWTTVSNETVEDPDISFKALGLLTYLLSRPDGWNYNHRHLAQTHPDGDYAVRAALTELETAGYLHRRKEHAEDGRWQWVRVVYERPVPVQTVMAVTTDHDAVNHDAVTAMWETASVVKTKEVKTEIAKPSATPTEPPPTKPRNLPWDALSEVVGWEPHTKSEKARFGKALREVKEALTAEPDREWTDENVAKAIRARGARYRREWPTYSLTPESLLKHWTEFGPNRPNPIAPASPLASKTLGEMSDEEFKAAWKALKTDWERDALEGLRKAELAEIEAARKAGSAS